MIKLKNLLGWLDREGLFASGTSIYDLISQASLERFREKIDKASRNREEPFADWFGKSGRAYVPLISSHEQKIELIKSNHSHLLGMMNDLGLNWTAEDLAAGVKDRSHFNGKFARDILAVASFREDWETAQALGLPVIPFDEAKKEIKKLWINLWNWENISADTIKESFLQEAYEVGGLEADNWAINVKRNINFLISEAKGYLNSGIKKDQNSIIMVLTSRPDDIAGISTDRRWRSCLNLDDGEERRAVYCEIATGGFAAYLIKADDLEIEDPLARVLVRRFDSLFGKSYAVPEESVYSDGRDFPAFLPAIKAWLKEKQGDIPFGTYSMSGGRYSDTFDEEYEKEEEVALTPETIVDRIIDPKINKEDIKSHWIVTDKLHEYWEDIFAPDLLSLDIAHISRPKGFAHLSDAKEWIAKQDSAKWKSQIAKFIIDRANRYIAYANSAGGADNHTISELEGFDLTTEGSDIAEWTIPHSNHKRWSLREITAEEQVMAKKRAAKSGGLKWIESHLTLSDSSLRRWMKQSPKETIRLKEYLENSARTEISLRYLTENVIDHLIKNFPAFFPDDRNKKNIKSIHTYTTELAHYIKNLDAGEEREGLKGEALALLRDIYSDNAIISEYQPKDIRLKASPLSSKITYFTALSSELSKDPKIKSILEKIFVNLYHKNINKVNRPKKLERDVIVALDAIHADSPSTVQIYKSLLENALEADDGGETALFSLYFNLLKLGENGRPLIPVLESLYKSLKAKKKKSKRDGGGSELYITKIYKIIKNIREDKPQKRAGELRKNNEAELLNELERLI
jgi:hypothetical protein